MNRAISFPGFLIIKSFYVTESENSFNGEPQAEAKRGNDACGLPLNDAEVISWPASRGRRQVGIKMCSKKIENHDVFDFPPNIFLPDHNGKYRMPVTPREGTIH